MAPRMLRLAYSTVACPDWTLERVAHAAFEHGFLGVELRSEGEGGTAFASEPGLTDPMKVRSVFREAGVELAGLATGVRFDAPVFPPVIGNVLPAREAAVREGKHMIELAGRVGAPFVRVFAFEVPGRERRGSALRRICERLAKVVDHARNRDVRILIENGGSFPSANDLVEILDRVGHPLLSACYDLLEASNAGDDLSAGCSAIGRRLSMVRVRDRRGDRPCLPGDGDLPCREFIGHAARVDADWGVDPWVVFTWDKAWIPDLAPADQILPEAAKRLHAWAGREVRSPAATARATVNA